MHCPREMRDFHTECDGGQEPHALHIGALLFLGLSPGFLNLLGPCKSYSQ